MNIPQNYDGTDCTPFNTVLSCKTRVFIQEDGDGATYKKVALVYV